MARNPQIATVTDEATGKDYAIRLSDTVKAGVRSVRFYADWNLGPVVTDTFAACEAQMRAMLGQMNPGEWEEAIRVVLFAPGDTLPLTPDAIQRFQVARLSGGVLLLRQAAKEGGRPPRKPYVLPPGTTFPGSYIDNGTPSVVIPYTAVTLRDLRRMAQVGVTLADTQTRGLNSLADGDVDGYFNDLDAVMQALAEALRRIGVDIIVPEGV